MAEASMDVVQLAKTGMGAGCLVDATAPRPVPGPGQVLVRVSAVAANPVDYKIQRGDFGEAAPTILGHDVVGTVMELGEGVGGGGSAAGGAGAGSERDAKATISVGDRVAVFVEGVGRAASNGGYAGYVAAHTRMVAKVPAEIGDESAVGCILTGLTAYECVVKHAKVSAGQTVLVTGAAGGVGSMVAQLCRHFVGKAGRVITTAGGEESFNYVRELGFAEADIVRYRGKTVEALTEEVKALTDGKGVDVAFDNVGADMKRLCFQAAAMFGHVVSIVEEPKGYDAEAVALWDGRRSVAFAKNLAVHFEFLGAAALLMDEEYWHYGEELAGLLALVAAGTITAPRYESMGVLSAEVVSRMHSRLVESSVRGKLTALVPASDTTAATGASGGAGAGGAGAGTTGSAE